MIFASKAGAPTNPDWYHNLKAHPEVQIEVGPDTIDVTATEAQGAERDRLFNAQAERVPNFAAYADENRRTRYTRHRSRTPGIGLGPSRRTGMPLRLATWNVNSLPARLPRVLEWLDRVQPDVLCLQETKVSDAAFPHGELTELGYEAAADGEGGYNGVAILSRVGLEEVRRGSTGSPDSPARSDVPSRRSATVSASGRSMSPTAAPSRALISNTSWRGSVPSVRRPRRSWRPEGRWPCAVISTSRRATPMSGIPRPSSGRPT